MRRAGRIPVYLYILLMAAQFFEDGIFSPFMTDKKGCRFELGCRGPWSGCDSATRKWNGGVNWCIANATCVGCTSPNFPDGMSPFYEN